MMERNSKMLNVKLQMKAMVSVFLRIKYGIVLVGSYGLLYRMSVPRLLRRFFVNIVFSGNCSVEIGCFTEPKVRGLATTLMDDSKLNTLYKY